MDERATMKNAFDALLRGDTAERDRLCGILMHRHRQRVRVKEGGPLFTEPLIVVDLVDRGDGVMIPKPQEKIHGK